MGLGTMMIAAGALQGVGGAMAQQGMLDAQQRREIALENLRTQNRKSEQSNQYDLMDRNDSRQTVRATNASIARDQVQAGIQSKQQDKAFQQQLTLKTVDFANDKEMANLRGAIERGNAAYGATLRQKMESGEVVELFAGGDGVYYQRTRDGRITSTGVSAPAKELDGRSSSGGGSVLDAVRAKQGAAPTPGPVGVAKPQQTASKVVSQAQIADLAKQRGISVADAKKWAATRGYQVK